MITVVSLLERGPDAGAAGPEVVRRRSGRWGSQFSVVDLGIP